MANPNLHNIEKELRAINSYETERSKMENDYKSSAFIAQEFNRNFKNLHLKKGGKNTSSNLDQKKPGQFNLKREKQCTICKKKGHTETNCWFRDSANTTNPVRNKRLPKDETSSEEDSADLDATFLTNDNTEDLANTTRLTAESIDTKSSWIVDSGATAHMCKTQESFKDLSTSHPNSYIEVANGTTAKVEGIGSVRLSTSSSTGKKINITLENVLFVPTLGRNLLSVRAITNNGHSATFKNGGGDIQLAGRNRVNIPLEHRGKLYILNCKNLKSEASQTEKAETASVTLGKVSKADLETWHQRLGHIGQKTIKKLVPYVEGMQIKGETLHKQDKCEICVATKMSKKPFSSAIRRTTKPLELVHSDIAGPMRTPTAIDGHIYAINFIDDYTREVKVYTMKHKSEALDKVKQYIADSGKPTTLTVGSSMPEKLTEEIGNKSKLSSLRTDNGGKYLSGRFTKFCLENGIKRELTIAHTPEQNGVAERCWRTLFGMIRSMLKEANLDNKWWGRALVTAAYLETDASPVHSQTTRLHMR